MSNIISFADAKRKKENASLKKIEINQNCNDASKKIADNRIDSSFLESTSCFKFMRMLPPGFFAIVNTKNLPDPFPSDPLPPMAA